MTKRNFYIYWWQDLDYRPATDRDGKYEVKFGDTFQPNEAAVKRYIRNSLGRQKHKFDDGRILILGIRDVSTYAKSKGRFKLHGKIDDVIREKLPGHYQSDVHQIDDIDEFEIAILKEIRSRQTPPTLALRPYQYDDLGTILDMIHGPKRCRRILAELAPRYGKTVTMLALARELQTPLTIVASYVLSSFSSFDKECLSWKQFKNFVAIDSKDKDAAAKVRKAIKNGKQAVVFLSMCGGGMRQDRIDSLFGIRAKRLVIVDEADFGAHKPKQAIPLAKATKKNDIVVLMTGTDWDKAAACWQIDGTIQTSYQELLEAKKAYVEPAKRPRKLRHFKKDKNLLKSLVDLECYQMPLQACLDRAKRLDPTSFTNSDELPSWAKVAENPTKAKGFLTLMLEAMFLGQHNLDHLNVDLQLHGEEDPGLTVALMWLPYGTPNKNLDKIVGIARGALPGWEVITLHGGKTTNRKAEKKVTELVQRAQRTERNVLIISAILGMRSFSVANITEIYLAYDEGSMAVTQQRLARALTPDRNNPEKIAKIISLSFDPNRDGKFDSMILDSAARLKDKKGTEELDTMGETVRQVLKTNSFSLCTDDGPVRYKATEYLKNAMANGRLSRVMGNSARVHEMSPAMIQALASADCEGFAKAKQDAAKRGKTFKAGPSKRTKSKTTTSSSYQKMLAKARQTIEQIIQNIRVITLYGTPGDTIETYFAKIEKESQSEKDWLSSGFGMDYKLVREVLLCDQLNRNLIELQMAKYHVS